MPVDFPVSWIDIHRASKKLIANLKAQTQDKTQGEKWDRVIAVTRGGMVPACLVARDLDIRRIDTISVKSYDHQSQTAAEVLSMPQGIDRGAGCLIVDDLSDTGNTFKALRALLPEATYICLYVKPQGKPLADCYATEVAQDCWIYFPWEDQDFPPHIMDAIGSHLQNN